jgi:tetratricopeptide (TPR) repeat protein
MRTPTILLAAVLLGTLATADEVFLKGGGRLSGRIVTRTPEKIEVDVGAGLIGVPASSVLKIEEGRSPLHDYDERARQLAPGDADGWVALAQWAEARGLGTQARQAYERALLASPNDPRANEALGNVLMEGRWVSEEESYRARGYVRFEGEWITPAEHEAIQRQRAAEAERDRQMEEAEARVREAEARAEEAEARAQEAEARQDEGIPMWYSWGGVPSYWSVRPIVSPHGFPAPRTVPR